MGIGLGVSWTVGDSVGEGWAARRQSLAYTTAFRPDSDGHTVCVLSRTTLRERGTGSVGDGVGEGGRMRG